MSEQNHVQSLYRCTPRQVRGFMIDIIQAGLVPNILGSPGCGKSQITHSIADEYSLHLIDERLSTRSPVDLAGIPDFIGEGMMRRAAFTPFDTYPLQTTPIPDGKNGWLLFLDEFNSAPKNVQAAAYKLVLDRMVGLHKLHENVAIVCAGNQATDRAIVTSLSTAMQSRLVHLIMEVNFREWYEDVAMAQFYDERIRAFLTYQNGKLMDFRPDHNEHTFCCPRTWEFMNALVKGKAITDDKIPMYAGTITSGVAVEFVQFTKVYEDMPTEAEILRDPLGCRVPNDPPTRWAVISHLLDKIDDKKFEAFCDYTNRFSTEFKVLFFRSALLRNKQLRTHPSFAKAAVSLSRYLHGD